MSEPTPEPNAPLVPPEEDRGFFAKFTQNHVAATLLALAFIVAGAAIDGIISGITKNDIVISPSNDPVIGRSARNQSWQIAVR